MSNKGSDSRRRPSPPGPLSLSSFLLQGEGERLGSLARTFRGGGEKFLAGNWVHVYKGVKRRFCQLMWDDFLRENFTPGGIRQDPIENRDVCVKAKQLEDGTWEFRARGIEVVDRGATREEASEDFSRQLGEISREFEKKHGSPLNWK